MKEPRISLVITTYNRSSLLRLALESVAKSEDIDPASVEVVVVDNNSSDDTHAVVEGFTAERYPFTLRYIFETNQGLSHARNRGLTEAKGAYIAFMDDDQMIHKHYLASIEPVFSSTGADCAGGPLRYYNAVDLPDWLPPLLEHVGNFDAGEELKPLTDGDDTLRGGNMVFPQRLLEELGGFDVNLGRVADSLMSDEETELQQRMLARNMKIIYSPKLIQYHYLDPDRLHKRYWRRHRFDRGRTLYRLKHAETSTHTDKAILGVPRWLLSHLVTRELRRYFLSSVLRKGDRFGRQLQLFERLGQLHESRQQTRAVRTR